MAVVGYEPNERSELMPKGAPVPNRGADEENGKLAGGGKMGLEPRPKGIPVPNRGTGGENGKLAGEERIGLEMGNGEVMGANCGEGAKGVGLISGAEKTGWGGSRGAATGKLGLAPKKGEGIGGKAGGAARMGAPKPGAAPKGAARKGEA